MMKRSVKVFALTILSILVSYYVAVLMHEYAHAMMAWLLGYKTSPFDIYIGNWLLIPVSESVDYASILASGHGIHEALIGISGISMTFILFLISLFCINQKFIQKHIIWLSIFFWLTEINLMEMFSYINRTFVMGDLWEFIEGLGISPLLVLIPGLLIVFLALYRFYKVEIVKMYALLPIETGWMQRIFLWITFWPLTLTTIYWERPVGWEILSNITNIVSLLMITFILIACDPANRSTTKRL